MLYKPNLVVPTRAPSDLDPNFITGFTDAEGSFMLSILKNSERHIGWSVGIRFEISLHQRDEKLLNQINAYFQGAGIVTKFGVDKVSYRVNNLEEIITFIIPHFEKFPLNTKKREDFELFSKAAGMIRNKEHLTLEGLDKLVSIRASMNLGLSEQLKISFPLCKPGLKFTFSINNNFHPQWIAGFTTGEGYFGVKLLSSSTIKTGIQVKLVFQITQHTRDELLLKSLVDFFGCGKYYSSRVKSGDFQVGKISDIVNIIIPFFENNLIRGEKSKDFSDWCKIAFLVKEGKHLTKEGLDQIIKIRNTMNTNRY